MQGQIIYGRSLGKEGFLALVGLSGTSGSYHIIWVALWRSCLPIPSGPTEVYTVS